MEMVARHFARDSGVTVLFEENAVPNANLRTKTITLPSNLEYDSKRVVLAWLLHESAHIRWTEASVLKRIRPSLFLFINCLEDVRIESKLFERYPGTKDYLFKQVVKNVTNDPARWKKVGRVGRTLISIILEAEGFGEFVPDDEEVRSFFQEHEDNIKGIMLRACSAASTADIIPLAVELVKLIMDPALLEQLFFHWAELGWLRKRRLKVLEKKYELRKRSCSVLGRINYLKKNVAALPETSSANKKRIEFATQIDDLEKELIKIEKCKDKLTIAKSKLEEKIGAAKDAVQKMEHAFEQEIGTQSDLFEIQKSSLRYRKGPSLKQSFDELLLKKLRQFKQKMVAGHSRINTKQLPHVYTKPDKLFVSDTVSLDGWKRIYFLLDASGSMAVEGRAEMVCWCVKAVAESIERCKKKVGTIGALHYEIWIFNSTATKIKSLDKPFTEKTLDAYAPSGGTSLETGLVAVSQAIRASQNARRCANVVVCMTDAELYGRDILAAKSFRDGQTIFLGIGAEPDRVRNPRIQALRNNLILRHNITTKTELGTVLRKAVLESLTT